MTFQCYHFHIITTVHIVLDSWGKFPSGILYGNNNELGNFDECMRVQHPIEYENTTSNLAGKYCLVQLYSSTISKYRKIGISNSLSIKGMDARMLAQKTPNHTYLLKFVEKKNVKLVKTSCMFCLSEIVFSVYSWPFVCQTLVRHRWWTRLSTK